MPIFYIISYYINWVTTSWTYSINAYDLENSPFPIFRFDYHSIILYSIPDHLQELAALPLCHLVAQEGSGCLVSSYFCLKHGFICFIWEAAKKSCTSGKTTDRGGVKAGP